MAKGYIYLSVKWSWEVERLQDALYDLYGYSEDWEWTDPYTYHITLAYADDVTDEQLLDAAKAVMGKNAVEVSVTGIGTFESGADGKAVYLKVEPTEDMLMLQRAVAEALVALGVTISEFSDPDKWIPHLTLAYAPTDAVIPNSELNVQACWASTVCIARSDYEVVAEIPLKWDMSQAYGEDGSGPVAEMLTEVAAASWKVGASKDLPIGKDTAWDGAAAKKSIFDAAGFGTDKPDTEMARKAFLIYNASAPTLKGSYKVPFAEMRGGEMVASPAGIRNAASRLPQVKGVAQETIDKARKVLDGYEKKAGIGEMATEQHPLIRMTMISEFKGNYPNVPLPDDIDMEAIRDILGKGIDFVTLPIGQVDAESGNGRKYLKSAVEEMVEQVNRMRPEGIWGHMTQEEMATRYDKPAIRWLGALIDKDGVAWGKGLPLDVETHNYYQLARATNARAGTSLTAFAEMKGEDVEHLSLLTIDIADPNRVGVPITAAMPQLTKEMGDVIVRVKGDPAASVPAPAAQEQVNHQQDRPEEEPMLTEQQIQEMEASVARQAAQISELTTQRDAETARADGLVTENEKVATLVGELLAEYVVSVVKEAVAIEKWRPLIAREVQRLQPQSKADVDEAVKKVLDDPINQEALKVALSESMGPIQQTPSGANAAKTDEAKAREALKTHFDVPVMEGV